MTLTAAHPTRRPSAVTTDRTLRRAAVYCRISRDNTGEQLGVHDQEARCRRLTEAKGWTVHDDAVFVDNSISASSGKARPRYLDMLKRVRAGQIDTIVAVDQDRLLRRPVELEELVELADKLGLWVVTLDGSIDLTTTDGVLHARIRAAVAADEVRRKGDRQRRAEERDRAMGKPPRRYSFGYRPGGMELEPREALAVRAAYRYLLVTGGRGSLAKIARSWNRRGLRTAFGRSAHEWRGETVRKVLTNARNAGIRTFYGEELGTGDWPAIVPEQTFRDVVALLDHGDRRTNGGDTRRKWLGGSLYRCGVCGTDVRVSYRGDGVRVYHCRAQKHLTRTAQVVDDFVLDVVRERLGRADVADLLHGDDPELENLAVNEAVAKAHVDRIEADYKAGEITARLMNEATSEYRSQLVEIQRRRSEILRASRLAVVLGADDPVVAFDAQDVTTQQAVIDALCEVTLEKARPGIKTFDPSTVTVAWR